MAFREYNPGMPDAMFTAMPSLVNFHAVYFGVPTGRRAIGRNTDVYVLPGLFRKLLVASASGLLDKRVLH